MATWRDIDLSFMLQEDRTPINCRTKEGFRSLAQAIYRRFPAYKEQLDDYVKFYKEYNNGEGMALRAELIGRNRLSLGYCNAEWYEANGYKVIELCDITHGVKDLGALDTGYIDMNAALAALF